MFCLYSNHDFIDSNYHDNANNTITIQYKPYYHNSSAIALINNIYTKLPTIEITS